MPALADLKVGATLKMGHYPHFLSLDKQEKIG
jgi:hypothetical protein